MANIRIKDLPADGAPKQTDLIPIDLGSTRHATVKAVVESGRPTASKTEAEAGVDASKSMTPLTTKQAIDAQVGAAYVPKTVKVNAGSGMTGGGELSGDVTVGLTTTNIDRLNKVDGIAVGATANQTDAYLLDRGNHTGSQAISTVSGLQSALDSKATAAQGDKADSAVQSVNGKSGNSVTITADDVGAVPDTFVDDIDDNTLARHTHSNKTILDATTASFLAAEKTKLSGIEAGAQVNTVTSVAGKTGAVALVKADVGLGNVDNTSDASKPVSTATQSALNAKANSSVTVSAGSGLTGGGNLTANRNIALNAASISSLGKADTALQAPGGATGQILAKASADDNDVSWVTSEAATAVSYGPQELTEAQKTQARDNIDAVRKTGDTGIGGFQSSGKNLGNLSGLSINLSPTTSNFQYGVNNGAFTLNAPPDGYYSLSIKITNASGAGAATLVGFSAVHGGLTTAVDKVYRILVDVSGNNKIAIILEANL